MNREVICMFRRFRTLVVPSLLFVAACSGDSTSTPPDDPGDPGGPGGPGGPGVNVQPTDQKATGLGMAIMSSDAAGMPRLIRSIVPRTAAAGMTPAAAARDHVMALKELWVGQNQAMDLVERGTQTLRNGATVVMLSQEIDGITVNSGDINVLMHTDGSLAAGSGTLAPATLKPNFVSSPSTALGYALDKQYGASRPQLAITEAGDAGGWQKLEGASTPDVQVEGARARRELARVGNPSLEAWRIEVTGTAARELDPPR